MGNNQSDGTSKPDLNTKGGGNISRSFANLGLTSELKKKSCQEEYPDFIVNLSKILEQKSLEEENSNGICKKTFQKYICKASKSLGNYLFNYFLMKEGNGTCTRKDSKKNGSSINGKSNKKGESFSKNANKNGTNLNEEASSMCKESNKEVVETMSRDSFVRQSSILLNQLTDSQQLEYYINVFSGDNEEMSYHEFYELVAAAYEMAQLVHNSSSHPDTLLSAVAKAVMHGKEKTTCKYICNWVCQHCPRIVLWMHRSICHALTVGYATIPKNFPIEGKDKETPVLVGAFQSSCATLYPSLIWMLSCSLPPIFTENACPATPPESDLTLTSLKNPQKFVEQLMLSQNKSSHWIPLFHSNEHGFSMNRFKHHVFDYHGPTILFITAEDESLFCLALDVEWKDSKHFYGNYQSMCLQLIPEYKVIERGVNLIYFNLTSRGFPTGLQVGADKTDRALSMDENFELVHYRKIPYKLKSLEVWGCGTTHDKEKQNEYKKQANKDVERRRKVNLDQLEWKDNPDRYLLEMAGTRPNYLRFQKDTQSHDSMK